MSTLKTTYLRHPSATVDNIEMLSNGTVDATINGYTTTTSVSGHVVVITGERAGAMSAGQNLSFGNAATDQSQPIPYAGKVIAGSLFSGPSHTGTTTLQVLKNGSTQGASYELSVTGAGVVDTEVFGTPLSFSAGDRLNLQCTAASTPGDGVSGTLVIRFD
jgi:hypothetical protein